MSGRFFGKWPVDAVGNPMIVTIQTDPRLFKDSHREALTRVGAKLKTKALVRALPDVASDPTRRQGDNT